MGLETVTFINDLVSANPLGTDGLAEGDNHIRNIKTALLGTFPGMAGRGFRVQSKSANYTVVLNDNTSLINCTATLTLTLTAVTTLGNGFIFHVLNNTRGLVTIDPNASELINGYLNYVVLPDRLVTVFSDGAAFYVIDTPEQHANPIINSAMRFWGEGTATLTAGIVTTLRHLATGMSLQIFGTVGGQIVGYRDSAVPSVLSSHIFPLYSTKLRVKIAVTTATVGSFIRINMEGYNINQIAQRPFTFSMWIRSSVTGTYNLSIQNGSQDQSYVRSFSVSTVNTYEFKRFLIPASPSAGVWGYSESTGMVAKIALAWAGITATDDAWTAADRVASTANVNFAGTLSASMNICAPLISLGHAHRLWTPDLPAIDVLNCSRYFIKTFDPDVLPSDALTGVGSYTTLANNAGFFGFSVEHNLRVTPSVTIYNPSFAGANTVSSFDNLNNPLISAYTATVVSTPRVTRVESQTQAASAANSRIFAHATFDARL